MPDHATARVFFALWPDAEVRRALSRLGAQMQRRVEGRLTREDSIHMTLLFLGATPVERLDALAALATDVPFEPFTLHVDRAACWKHNQIAWVAPSAVPPALAELVRNLQSQTGAAGLSADVRAFVPHVTLVRKARCAPLDPDPPRIRWDVRDFVLVRSELGGGGSRYSVIGRWPADVAGPAERVD